MGQSPAPENPALLLFLCAKPGCRLGEAGQFTRLVLDHVTICDNISFLLQLCLDHLALGQTLAHGCHHKHLPLRPARCEHAHSDLYSQAVVVLRGENAFLIMSDM